jgi:ferredoxin
MHMAGQQWQIEVDRSACMGSGVCVGVSSGHFILVDRRSSPKAGTVAPDETVLDAAESCPVEAILVRAADTNQVLAPAQDQ